MQSFLTSVVSVVALASVSVAGAAVDDVPLRSPQTPIYCVQRVSIEGIKTPKPKAKPKPKIAKEVTKLVKNIIAPGEVENIINTYANQYKVDSNLMKKIAKCESTFNANAVNGRHAGMYQFADTTWVSTRKTMGLDPNPSLRFDPHEATKTAAFKIANGGKQAWAECL